MYFRPKCERGFERKYRLFVTRELSSGARIPITMSGPAEGPCPRDEVWVGMASGFSHNDVRLIILGDLRLGLVILVGCITTRGSTRYQPYIVTTPTGGNCRRDSVNTRLGKTTEQICGHPISRGRGVPSVLGERVEWMSERAGVTLRHHEVEH